MTKKKFIPLVLLSLMSGIFIGSIIAYFSPIKIIVNGESMEPTLLDGSKHYVKRIKAKKDIKKYDIVTCNINNNKSIVKRVIGTPGEVIGYPWLDKEITLKHNEYFLVGDNIYNSYDSRNYGPVKFSSLEYIVIDTR